MECRTCKSTTNKFSKNHINCNKCLYQKQKRNAKIIQKFEQETQEQINKMIEQYYKDINDLKEIYYIY